LVHTIRTSQHLLQPLLVGRLVLHAGLQHLRHLLLVVLLPNLYRLQVLQQRLS
jgi:hypothetical protein